MESRAKLFGHPVHQMLVVFPVGLLATSVVFDAIYLVNENPLMAVVAFWMMAAGIIGGLLAAPFGFLDWRAIPQQTRAKSVGALHGLGNVLVLLLFGSSWLIRRSTPDDPAALASVLSFVGAGLAVVTAWLGGELVDRLGIGVADRPHVNAPSSLHTHHEVKHRYP